MPLSTLQMRPCWEAGVWMEVQPAEIHLFHSKIGVLDCGEHRGMYAAIVLVSLLSAERRHVSPGSI